MIHITKKTFDSVQVSRKRWERKWWWEIFSKLEIWEWLKIEKEEFWSYYPTTQSNKWYERYWFKMSYKVVDGYIYCLRVE